MRKVNHKTRQRIYPSRDQCKISDKRQRSNRVVKEQEQGMGKFQGRQVQPRSRFTKHGRGNKNQQMMIQMATMQKL
jgi:hypothetical protein